MELKIRHSLFAKIANEQKKSTSRLGERDVEVGEKLIFRSTDDENFAYETTVIGVKVCKFSEIKDGRLCLSRRNDRISKKCVRIQR